MRKIFLIFLISLLILNISYSNTEANLQKALQDYNNESLYSALEEVSQILSTSDKKSKTYQEAILLASKIYLSIGQKTGLKEYLWTSLNLINMYVGAGGNLNADYYYTKGLIFERLSFYNRALTNYKIALLKKDSNNISNKIILGIMRTSILMGNNDNITKYIIYLAPLQIYEGKELSFILGMKYFYNKQYDIAFEYFKEVYSSFEHYLLDNPDFYYYVAETAYRLKNYSFAKILFRKIVTNVKNDDVIRKSYLRLGDIAQIENDKIESFQNYLTVINRFPETQENTVARIKMLALALKYPDLESKIEKIKGLEDPVRFIITTLISNRTNYIGKYAIGNFGVLVFQYPSDFLYKRLSYELSIIYPYNFSFEQSEYIRDLWSSYLLKIDKNYLKELYLSNPKFFKDIFDEDILKRIVSILNDKKDINIKIDLLSYLVQKYGKDEYKIILAENYYYINKLDKAYEILESMKDKNCEYYTLTITVKTKLKMDTKEDIKSFKSKCDINNLPFEVAFQYYFSIEDYRSLVKLLNNNKEKLKVIYEKDENFRNQINTLLERLYNMKDYNNVISIVDNIDIKLLDKNMLCKISSMALISKIKSKEVKNLEMYYNYLKSCNDELSFIASQMYENYKILMEVKR